MRVVAPALKPWVDGVDQLAEADHVLSLARILDRMVPPRTAGRAQRMGMPDGVGGFGRRGPVERLVPSAWALAKLAPLEFLRRFTQQELLYSELQRRQPVEGRRVVLAFDVGPDQLGTPRLAQLALWVALASRAARAGDELVPVLLQQPELLLPSGFRRAGVRAWSDGRARTGVERASAVRAVQRCGPWRPGDRLWWISPEALPPEVVEAVEGRGASVSAVRLDDELHEDQRRVRVSLRHRSRRAEVLLPPMDPGAAARILRDPLRRREVARVVGDPWFDSLLWAASGRRLMARARNGQWVAVAVPQEGSHHTLKTTPVPGLAVPIVAVGWARGHAVSVGYDDGRWVMSGSSHSIATGPAPPPGVGTVVTRRGPSGTWIQIGGELFRWLFEDDGHRVVPAGKGTMGVRDGSLCLLRRQGSLLQRVVVSAGIEGEERVVRELEGAEGFLTGEGALVALTERALTDGTWTYILPERHELAGVVVRRGARCVLTVDDASQVHAAIPYDRMPRPLGPATGPVHVGPQDCAAWLEGGEVVVHEILPRDETATLRVRAPGRIP